jgi:hypothetical protein
MGFVGRTMIVFIRQYRFVCAILLLLESGCQAGVGDSKEKEDTGSEKETDAPETGDLSPFSCPDSNGMVPILNDAEEIQFCIDIFEARITSNPERIAESVEGVLPTVGISWYDAKLACGHAGKRLCTVPEWTDACDGTLGPGGQAYPYGNSQDYSACWTESADGSAQVDSIQVTGSSRNCVSPWGVHDMVGNVWEWADSQTLDESGVPITAKLGGAYYSGGADSSCAGSGGGIGAHPPDFKGTIAPRCCVDPVQ